MATEHKMKLGPTLLVLMVLPYYISLEFVLKVLASKKPRTKRNGKKLPTKSL